MFHPRRTPFLLLTLAALTLAAALATARADAQPGDSRVLASCSDCWPLSSIHPRTVMAPDDAGGAYLAWVDGSTRLRVIRLGADLGAVPPWTPEGLVLAPELRDSRHIQPALAPDGRGGLYVAWVEQDPQFDMRIRLLRLRADGSPAPGWPSAGLPVLTPSTWATYPVLALLPEEGVAVAYMGIGEHGRAVRLMAFDAHGQPATRWPSEGLWLGDGQVAEDALALAADDRGGLYVTWTEIYSDMLDLKMAWISPYGVPSDIWTLASKAVALNDAMMERQPELIAEGRDGGLVVWTDWTRGRHVLAMELTDVLAQRMSARGEPRWEPGIGNGHVVAAGIGYQEAPHLIGDDRGGGFFSWNESGPQMPENGRLVHLDAGGRPADGWPAAGFRLGSEVSGLFSDLAGGALATYFEDGRTMLARVPRDWSPGGAVAAVALGAPRPDLRLTADGRGGAFLAWEERAGTQVAVRIQHVGAGSFAPVPGAAPPVAAVSPAPAFAIYPIRPNPARGSCRIEFDLPAPSPVEVDVFDVAGRRVARLSDGRILEAGPHSLSWRLDGRDGGLVASGLYLVRVTAGRDRAIVRMAVTR